MNDPNHELAASLIASLIFAVVLFAILPGHFVYGEWTCTFAHCLKVKR